MACQSCLPPMDLSPTDPGRRAEAIKSALKDAGFTLTQLSALTVERYGKDSAYFLPPTFLHKLLHGVTPHVCQIAALSTLTRHRFTDWMNAFGFDLSQIPRFQVRLHRERTVLVTPVETNAERGIQRAEKACEPSIATRPKKSEDFDYLYAKIGTGD